MEKATHTDDRCAECQKANPILRPFVEKIWYCATCKSVLCAHTVKDPTTYGNGWCKFHQPKRKI